MFQLSTQGDIKMDHKFIRQMNVGDQFESIYFLENFTEKVGKSGNKYTDMTFRDKTGSANVRFFGVLTDIKRQEFVYAKGKVDEFNGKPNIVAQISGFQDF